MSNDYLIFSMKWTYGISAKVLINFTTIFDKFKIKSPYEEVTKKSVNVRKPYITGEIETLIREKLRLQRLFWKYPI